MSGRTARDIAHALGRPLRLFATPRPALERSLSDAERTRLAALRGEERRRDWLRGRSALKRALAALGRDPDTAALVLPDREVSLTHSAHLAVAAAVPGADGVGVDHEPLRAVDEAVARWFLSGREERWIRARAARQCARELLRLWTVKEALFKAFPRNAHRVLADFTLDDPALASGPARLTAEASPRFRYASIAFAGGVLSVAIFEEGGHAR